MKRASSFLVLVLFLGALSACGREAGGDSGGDGGADAAPDADDEPDADAGADGEAGTGRDADARDDDGGGDADGSEDGGRDDADVAGDEDAATGPDADDAGEVAPAQLLLIDEVYTHDTETMAFSYFDLRPGFPEDLVSPVDYASGHYHSRLEVRSKPSDRAVSYQLCFFQDAHTSDNHACVSQSGLHFTTTGTYEHDQTMASVWQHDAIDWSRALLDLMLVVKDDDGDPVDTRYGFDGGWEGSPALDLYYPMEVRYTAVLVPEGVEFAGFPE